MDFEPNLSILPEPQLRLWNEFDSITKGKISKDFILYGGTAVALQLGHRSSIDFDFFCHTPFDVSALFKEISFLEGASILQQATNTLTCAVDRSGIVKISFFGLPRLKPIKEPLIAKGNGISVASLLDLSGMKVVVVQERAEAKDYYDIDAIIRAGISLPEAIAAGKYIYGKDFNPQISLKALSYFQDGDLSSLPEDLKKRLTDAIISVDLGKLPKVSPQ